MNDQANAYLRQRVFSATPEELRLMLLEGALRFARQGADGLRERNFEKSYQGIHQCQDILMELINALRPEIAPDLCRRLAALYTYMYRRLMEASSQRDADIVDEVIKLLDYERETWVMAMEKLREERAGLKAAASGQRPSSPREPAEDRVAGLSISVQG
ncbi:MAG: flagellar export chaperone FliS [Phycisphaerales bacterium]|nr:flagellar export chaperone FliS [Phycisphaerales bacterium]